jgi:hypothetical protein
VIPTLLLVGLLFGRWWRWVIPLGVLGWVLALMFTDVGSGLRFALSAGSFAVANLAVGVLVNQGVRASFRSLAASRGGAR